MHKLIRVALLVLLGCDDSAGPATQAATAPPCDPPELTCEGQITDPPSLEMVVTRCPPQAPGSASVYTDSTVVYTDGTPHQWVVGGVSSSCCWPDGDVAYRDTYGEAAEDFIRECWDEAGMVANCDAMFPSLNNTILAKVARLGAD